MKNYYSLLIHLLFVSFLSAQISQGGEPLSKSFPDLRKESVPVLNLPSPDCTELIKQDIINDQLGMKVRDAIVIPINAGLNNSGVWSFLPNGDKVWRLKIRAEGAFSLEVYYDDFYLPPGASMFIYAPCYREQYGAYTEVNNKQSGYFATEMIQGTTTTIEYYEPKAVAGQGRINIMDAGYRYRDILKLNEKGSSQSCEVDVACSEGDDWQDEARSVVRARTRIQGALFWCSGVLVNNTNSDCKGYVLTALHCAIDENEIQSNTSDYDLYRFYFLYQRPECGTGNASAGKTITGCSRRADSDDGGGSSGSDFLLVELGEEIPSNYEPHWAGWNASPNPISGGGVSIHHPASDVKKISTYSNVLITTSWGTFNTHWQVNWDETTNGHGVTEGGSSGSPLFDVNKRIVGTLTGGLSFCNDIQPGGQGEPDFYGKMSRHWSGNPNPANEKLKVWLDPANTGLTAFDGSDDPCGAVGISESVLLNELELFPNPTSGKLNLRLGNNFDIIDRIEIYDLMGSIHLVETKLQQSMTIDMGRLSNGLYQVVLITKDQKILSKGVQVMN